jgi:hypothetical protein
VTEGKKRQCGCGFQDFGIGNLEIGKFKRFTYSEINFPISKSKIKPAITNAWRATVDPVGIEPTTL